MPYETLRFLHAARTLVDHPLRDTGPLGPDIRGFVRGATTQAFRNVIAECLDYDVDFLLLTGDALDQSDFSVKARVELRDGFEQLADAGIQVFVVPGPRDSLAVWDDFPDLPSNVTVFRPETDDPVAVLRDGAVIASIRSLSWRQSWFAGSDDEPRADRIRSVSGHRSARPTDDELPHADRTQRRVKEADHAETFDDSDQTPSESLVAESDNPVLGGESAHVRREHSDRTNESLSKHDAHREMRRVQSPADLRPNHFAIA
ncbi:MAG TPA: hypothetical protein VK137_09635, partial [Planctomycetaceae bacterium]|nr:hypothetical protein [Planctomycetaceae bacterium]